MAATHRRLFACAAAVAASLLLASCGGGGGGSAPASGSAFPLSSTLANMCTLDGQKQYVRSYLDEAYLWYDEVPVVNAASYATVPTYFSALLAKPKDRYSAVLTASAADTLQSPPDALMDGGVPANLLAATVKSVPLTKVVTSTSGRRVGYILFNDHNAGAQDELIAAFDSLRTAGVDELVLDMRHNTGGYLYVAQTAASMVTGPQNNGRIFEQLRFNAKRQAETNASTYLFSSRVQVAETVYPKDAPLPQLNLPRVYVLTSAQTCSASESVINSLRGIDVQVVLVGTTTCGKPYGFHRQDNCGLAIFAIEFQGFNAKNSGDYTSGMPATCLLADNFTSALGSSTDPLLAGALFHIDNGHCPAVTTTTQPPGQLVDARANTPLATRQPWDGRLLK